MAKIWDIPGRSLMYWYTEVHPNLVNIYGPGPFKYISRRYQYGSVTWGIDPGWIYTLDYTESYKSVPKDSIDYRKFFNEHRRFEIHEMWLQ